jgi:hypothetical protein
MKIRTEFVYPPIPDRQFDWSAVDDDTYEPGCPIGSGRTELAAVKDLVQQLEEDYEGCTTLNDAFKLRLPPWESLDAWMRDCRVVAYYQGIHQGTYQGHVDGARVRRELHDALVGLLGLLQLIVGRDDMPKAIRDAIHENHRYHTAVEWAG